jgi:hypothetical protein
LSSDGFLFGSRLAEAIDLVDRFPKAQGDVLALSDDGRLRARNISFV